MNDATLFPGHRYAWIRIRGTVYRWRCGRRFGHFPAAGSFTCARCGISLL